MKVFVIISFFSCTTALPQGYNYQQPGFQSAINSHHFGKTGFNSYATSGSRFSDVVPTSYSAAQKQQRPVIVSKHFYIHSAPEESKDDSPQGVIGVGPLRKHYRVIFIKAPTESSKGHALALAQAQDEEKTVIYVLSKKSDAADLQANLESVTTPPSKPEVFFIKYKTQEEALHAQHQIQAQYDALGGTSEVSDEGLAPVTSVIGSLEKAEQDVNIDNINRSTSNFDHNVIGAYLPPSV